MRYILALMPSKQHAFAYIQAAQSLVAMIEEQGVPIELVETKLTDKALAELEKKKLGKSY